MSRFVKGQSGNPATQFRKGTSGNPNGAARTTIAYALLPLIKSMAAKGCRELDIARVSGVNVQTWRKLRDGDLQPEVARALAEGRAILHDQLINKLAQKAMAGDVACLIYSTKVLLGYRENDTSQDARPIVNITLPGAARSLEEWQRAITVQSEPLSDAD